ncbi:MAG: lamin tail domain-containing protein [Hassallia sp.]
MKNIIKQKRILSNCALILCVLGCWVQPARGEGSRTLYPSTAPAGSARANLEWSTDQYGGLIKRRTLLKVFANQDEYILVGSSAVGQGSGDIRIYNPGNVTGSISNENIPGTPDFLCSTQSGRGYINSRTKELGGPQSVDGTRNTNGYIPCYYKAPTTGVYDVVMYGPDGDAKTNGTHTGQLNLSDKKNFDTNQKNSVAAWDVTVRSSDKSSTADLNGRLFSYYLALFTGDNGRYLNFPVYPVTTDGYQYKIELRGLDPNGFVIYGSQVGFFDSDSKTLLYHDIVGDNAELANAEGGTKLAIPQYATFLNPIDPTVLAYIDLYRPDGTSYGTGIPSPTIPTVDTLNFTGTAGANNSSLGTGGSFTFNTNVPGNYEIVISRDGVDFDPTKTQNRVLRGIMPASGLQSVTWNGKDNSGDNFPVGTNYNVRVKVHSGEYHFPLIDAENNFTGGPTITMLNASNPLGNTRAFYDDRGYITVNGSKVGTPGSVLCGIGPTNPAFSDPINGFDTTTNDRKFGQLGNPVNANTKCNGSFGNTKGLDLWTYYPSNFKETPLNVIEYGVTISGTLYEDKDGGDDFDTGEPTLPAGITVKLIRTSDNSILTITTTKSDGTYTFTGVIDGDYKVQVDISSSNIPSNMSLGTSNNLSVSVTGKSITKKDFGFDVYNLSPQAGKVIINEVLYNETGNGSSAATNNEFIEIYNASDSAVDLSGWKLMDGNLITNDTDAVGSITGKSSPYLFPNGTTLAPDKYAVIWIGANNASHQASGAAFQDWLNQPVKLNNTGDDVWLYDSQTQIVDYIAYGSGGGINTPPPSSLKLWDTTYQSALVKAVDGQSISLTKNGLDGNTSACWEPTTSGQAKTQGCPNYLPTRDTDPTTSLNSAGLNNNGVPKLILVKRITRLNGDTTNGSIDFTKVVDDPNTTDDNNSFWLPNYLKGAIDGGKVKSGDVLEYTIYFIANDNTPVKNVSICDLVPTYSEFVLDSFGTGKGIALEMNSTTTNLTNINDSDRAEYIAPNTIAPSACNKADIANNVTPPKPLQAADNKTGAVLVNVVTGSTNLPEPNKPAYGFIRFHVKVK